MYPITKYQIQEAYKSVKAEGKNHGEALLILWEFYEQAFGLSTTNFRGYVMDTITDMENPVDAFDRAMNIIT